MCDFISGEKIQQLCDVYIGTLNDLNYNPKISIETYKHINIDMLNNDWNNPKLIFCYSCSLDKLMNKLHLFKNKFILVSHNSDNNITEKYLRIADHPLVIKWFSQNIIINHSKLILLPIGIANSMWIHGNLDNFISLENYKTNFQNKEYKIYFNFNIWTNFRERESCKNIIQNKGLVFENNISQLEYLNKLSNCKFAICPAGNGIDCHRIWECYYCNVIPILLHSKFTEHLAKILPCILLNNWNEFDGNQILPKYNEMLSLLKKNKKYLDFNYYKELILSHLDNQM
jgi:hypothetical protein